TNVAAVIWSWKKTWLMMLMKLGILKSNYCDNQSFGAFWHSVQDTDTKSQSIRYSTLSVCA
ncbi:hypothetical protein LWT65_23615, partial [Enterobacter hormaechei]|nr:hypothetical protein [Enterobacter hormaechei]